MLLSLINLEKLNLRNNKIREIAKNSFKCLSNLKELDLSINCLTQLDSELFHDLVCLEDINLSTNKITKIDNIFGKNLGLKYLRLERNKIQSINLKSLAKLVDLVYLNLVNNQIENLNINVIHDFICFSNKLDLFLDNDYFCRRSNFFEIANFK